MLYPAAQFIPSPHFDLGPNQPRYIIIHGTGYSLSQTAADVAHDFQTSNPNSTHFAIGRAGDVAQMVAVEHVAWGNGIIQAGPNHGAWWTGDPNTYTISIEHVNDSQNSTPLSPAQQAASFALVKWLCDTYGIKPQPADATGGIAGHFSIESVDRALCPGAYPWDNLWAYLKGAPMTFSPWLAPGAEAMSEFARQGNGSYLHATCVETAALMCLLAQRPHALPSTGDELQAIVNAWRAVDSGVSSEGASSYVDATNWLRGLGFQVDENIMDGNWWANMQTGLQEHAVFLVGVTNAQGLPGDESGVHNHGLAALGIDANGNIICGDPDNWAAQVNMPGNPIGNFVTYTQQDFINGSISSLTKVYPSMLSLSNPEVAKYFSQGTGHAWKCSNGFVLQDALLDFYCSMTGAVGGLTDLGLPLSNEVYGHTAAGTCYQLFERGVLVYDPNHVVDFPPGAGMVYIGKVSQFMPSGGGPDADDAALAAAQAEVASLNAQVTKDAATIAQLQAQVQAGVVPADLHSALIAAQQVLNPAAAAAADIANVMKELGF